MIIIILFQISDIYFIKYISDIATSCHDGVNVNQYYLVKLTIDSKWCPHGRVMGGTLQSNYLPIP